MSVQIESLSSSRDDDGCNKLNADSVSSNSSLSSIRLSIEVSHFFHGEDQD